MIINPSLPGGHVIFCDDIRHEQHGKVTFVGAYSGTMFVNGSLPTTLPKLCMGIVYREEPDSLEPVTIKVTMPNEEDETLIASFEMHPQADMIPPPSDEFTFREARFLFEAPNFTIPHEGTVLVRAYRGDDEIRLGRLNIVLNPEAEQQIPQLGDAEAIDQSQ